MIRPLALSIATLGLALAATHEPDTALDTATFVDHLLGLDAVARQQVLDEHFARPRRVRLPAGETALATSLKAITTTAPRLHLGVEESSRAHLAGFEGPFWQALLQVAAAYDLHIAPVAIEPGSVVVPERQQGSTDDPARIDAALCGGPVLLGWGTGGAVRHQTHGPLLLSVSRLMVTEARRLEGHERWVDFALGLRLEPDRHLSLVDSAQLVWDRSSDLIIGEGTHDDLLADRFLEGRSDDHGDPTTVPVHIRGLGAKRECLRLTGRLELTCRYDLATRFTLEPGKRVECRFGNLSTTVLLTGPDGAAADDEPLKFATQANTLYLEVPDQGLADAPGIHLSTADGTPVPVRRSLRHHSPGLYRYVFSLAAVIVGAHECHATFDLDLGTATVPLAVEVDLR